MLLTLLYMHTLDGMQKTAQDSMLDVTVDLALPELDVTADLSVPALDVTADHAFPSLGVPVDLA